MSMKLALLVIFVSSVTTLEKKPICKYGKEHKLTQVVCANFDAFDNEWRLNLTTGTASEKLIFRNISGSLDLSNITLPHLTFLSFVHGNIDNVSLGDFPKLIFLSLWKNKKFPNLTQDFFAPAVHINWLSIVSNNHSIAPNAFHLLQNLSWLHIQNQNFEYLSGEYLKENTKLHELSIRHCHLHGVDVDAFSNNPDLEILSMNFNELRYFKNGTFRKLKKLKILELHHNRFANFDLNQFQGLSSLEVLGLPSNFLRNITAHELLASVPSLKKMEVKKRDLVGNSGTKIIIGQLRKEGIDIIGTPHDSPHPGSCRIV